MRKLFTTLVLFVFTTSAVSAESVPGFFFDVDEEDWYYDYVMELVNNGVVDYAELFYPNRSLTRAEIVKMVIESFDGLEGFDLPETPTFSDVPPDAWFYPYVEAAAEKGIVEGYEDEKGNSLDIFGPGDTVTRAAAAKMIVNAYDIPISVPPEVPERELTGIEDDWQYYPEPVSQYSDPGFSDVNKGDWFYDYVVTGYNQNILRGYDNGTFGPEDPITRAQMAKLIVLSIDPYFDDDLLPQTGGGGFFDSLGALNSAPSVPTGSIIPGSGDTLGFSVGGANDINNFRQNIEEDYLPIRTDITPEGLFYDYFFETGGQQACDKLFCPSFARAISLDPFSQEDEFYLSLGLNSNLKQSDFSRKKLNLVVVLDISGSMNSSFDRYYYDDLGGQIDKCEIDTSAGVNSEEFNHCVADYEKSKLAIANESVVAMLDHLNPEDRFGIVLFDGEAYLGRPLISMSQTNVDRLKENILNLEPAGSTDWSAGMMKGTELFDDLEALNDPEYENRIIFLTDAMPNTGEISEEGLFGMGEANAANKIYSTFIGIGVDFNTELVEAVTKMRGANYYSVHSSEEFSTRLDDEFEFMVTPLVFDVKLTFESLGYDIEKVFGSPEADEATGEIMKINTLFPSKASGGEVRGGLVLLKLKRTSSDDTSIILSTSYEDRDGVVGGDEQTIDFMNDAEFYDNTGIRKGILLSRFVSLMQHWIDFERHLIAGETPDVLPDAFYIDGLIYPYWPELGEWERQSEPLTVSPEYKTLFEMFKVYLEDQRVELQDDDLQQEVDILDKLINL